MRAAVRQLETSDRAILLRQKLRSLRSFGQVCSLVQWDGMLHAKKAALDECGKAGEADRIVGAACAHGSDAYIFYVGLFAQVPPPHAGWSCP